MTRRQVALIGLMGSGKSTVARVVARSLGVRAVDVDETILSITGLPICTDGGVVGIVSLGDLAVAQDPASALADIGAMPPNS